MATLSLSIALISITSLCKSQSIPMTNPVNDLYGNLTQYSWTNAMVNWSCVLSVTDYKNDFDSAQSAVIKSCPDGGVVYFPAGTYTFTDNLNIKSGIIIRGEPTTSPAKNGRNPGNLSPKTIFKCPNMKHMGIFNADNSSNIGIVNINLQGCAVMFWPQLSGGGSPSFQNYWYQATGVIGAGSNKLILSNKITDVTLGNPSPGGDPVDKVTIPSEPWPWRFGTAIASYVDKNTLIGNNLIAKATLSSKTDVAGYNNVPYPYDNRYGIDVNQVLYGGVLGKTSGGPCLATPSNSKYYFAEGIVIRDNYIYMNGRVGLSWSGGDGLSDSSTVVGQGALLYNNHVEVAKGTTCYSVDGKSKAGNSATNENRGYNQAGYGNNLTMNTGNINRQETPGGYPTVDGEGVLHQCSSNNDGYRNIWYKNDLSGGESGYMLFYKLYHVDNNKLIDNKVNSDQSIGAVFDSAHDEHKGNSCSGNSPKCSGIPP